MATKTKASSKKTTKAKAVKKAARAKTAAKPAKKAPKATPKKPVPAKPAAAKKPPNPPEDPEEAIWKAIQKIDRAGIEAAVAAGASLDGNLSSIVYAEVKLSPKDVARAKLLLDLGADPAWSDPDENGNTILMQLSYAPNQDAALEVLDAMLAKKRNLSWGPANNINQTPLHVAMWYGTSTKFWDKLAALGNPISAVDKNGKTPMLDAVGHDNTAGIEWLLANGATLDGALAYAKDPSHRCSDKMVAWLAKKGAT